MNFTFEHIALGEQAFVSIHDGPNEYATELAEVSLSGLVARRTTAPDRP